MFKSLCLVPSIAPLLLYWYESRMFKLQRWWRTREFNIFGDCWQCLKSLTLESSFVSFFQFFCFAHCWCKFFPIKRTWKAIRVQGEELSTILLSIVLCLGSLTLEFHFVSFFFSLNCTLLLQVFFN